MTRRTLLLLLLLVLGLGITARPAAAQSITASLLIQTVNGLRAAGGLAAYQVDSSLMAYAQEHADYLAANNLATHVHSDGTSPWEHGIQENVATGSTNFMTTDLAVYTVWADEVHMKTMTGFTSGLVGAGVAYAADQVYLTLNVIGSGSAGSVPPASQPQVSQPQAQQPTEEPAINQAGSFPTATPQEDGSIVHLVVDGDTLATISETYGVGMDTIRALNGLAATSNLIFPGNYLIIATAPPPTLTPTLTPTVPRPTRTPTPFIPTRTPAPTRTASVTPVPSATPNPVVAGTQQFVETNRSTLLYVMGGLCVAGLLWVLWAGFIRKPREK